MRTKHCIVLCLLIGASWTAKASGVPLPADAIKYIPVLQQTIASQWPNISRPELLAAQIEQESCASLKSKDCWNPNAELKTPYEYGFGLGQLTIAYDSNHNVRFNNFTAMKQKYPSLKGWQWDDRFDPKYQMMTMVLMDKSAYGSVSWPVASDNERLAFMFSGYNGGIGGVIQDRTLCVHTAGCDPSKWFGNVEKQSFKTKLTRPGYGQSAFAINRGYVTNIFTVRYQKYLPYFNKKAP